MILCLCSNGGFQNEERYLRGSHDHCRYSGMAAVLPAFPENRHEFLLLHLLTVPADGTRRNNKEEEMREHMLSFLKTFSKIS